MKKLDGRGFTLAELLIVVAIIAVLVAVSIPVFAKQLEKSREETDMANLRSAYAIVATDALTDAYKVAGAGKYDADERYNKIAAANEANNQYWSYYDIAKGVLSQTAPSKSNGKGTSAKGGAESVDGPIYYTTDTPANGRRLIVVIQDKDGVMDEIFVGFAKSDFPASSTWSSSDFAA